MLRETLRQWWYDVRVYRHLPPQAREEASRDRAGLPAVPPDAQVAIEAALDWLSRAQDQSPTADGGVARHYSLRHGWGSSYPETTGYIVPTFLMMGERTGHASLTARGRRMLDWLVKIQLPGGGFQGGQVDATPVVPVTFNTGQILIGLADGVRVFGDAYRPAMHAAADFLVRTQDADGCWRSHATPFAERGEKAYESHVSWGLFEAARMAPDRGYGEAGLRQVRWSITRQRDNGWIADCCLSHPDRPLTHTLGYWLRGVLEAWRWSRDETLLRAARRTADALLGVQHADGSLPGRLRSDWSPAVRWVCLTGTVQIAHCWLMLFEATGDERYWNAGVAANAFVRRTMRVTGNADQRGGVKGSFPVNGEYGAYEYLNWAAKFFIDSHVLELDLRTARSPRMEAAASGTLVRNG